jgi:hypothetical protein
VKRELGLPTFKKKMRSIRIILSFAAAGKYLLANTESEGLDAGEKSRF